MLFPQADSHWSHTLRHFLVDAICCLVAFWAGAALRFEELMPPKMWGYLPSVLVAATVLPVSCYIFGLYSPSERRNRLRDRMLFTTLALCIMILAGLAMGSVHFDARVGRGVQIYGGAITALLVFLHHLMLSRLFLAAKDRIVLIMSDPSDEELALSLDRVHIHEGELLGAFVINDKVTPQRLKVLGNAADLESECSRLTATRVLCHEEHLLDPSISRALRVLRYHGVRVSTLAQAYEEAHQMVPLELVTDLWMLQASAHPEIVYIRKLKRSFDIVASLLLLIILGPICLAGMAIVLITSGRPIFFRQTRCGRLGKTFDILKLRTMRIDAEAAGAQWSSVKGDRRVTPMGAFMRKFRIDEIPQLINVLRGEMSFVGPRPERPEFVEQLEKDIPFFSERTLLHPGITGWAQVNYPYGASTDDARRKLEYDLYYLKHMGLLLDLFVILDTVKTVLCGGAKVRTPTRVSLTAPASADV